MLLDTQSRLCHFTQVNFQVRQHLNALTKSVHGPVFLDGRSCPLEQYALKYGQLIRHRLHRHNSALKTHFFLLLEDKLALMAHPESLSEPFLDSGSGHLSLEYVSTVEVDGILWSLFVPIDEDLQDFEHCVG